MHPTVAIMAPSGPAICVPTKVAALTAVAAGGISARVAGWVFHYDRTSHIIDNRHNDSANSGFHAVQHGTDIGIGDENVIDKGNDRQYEHRRDNGPKHRNQNSRNSAKLVSDDNRSVYSDGTRGRLRNGNQVQHFFLVNPMVLIHKFIFQQCYDYVDTPKSKGT